VDVNFTVQGGWVRLQFYRDSSTIGQIVQAEPGTTSGPNANSPVSLTLIDTPAAGTYTYTCRAITGAYAGGDFKFGEAAGPIFYAVELASAIGPTGPTGPVNSGYICQAYLSTSQVVAAAADTLVQFIDDLDPNNWWNSSSYRFQPTISGYYLISASVWPSVGATGGNQTNLQIRLNGSTKKAIVHQPVNTVTGNSMTISRILQLNGSTDYVDITYYTSSPGGQTIQASNGSWFYAALQ